MQLLVRALGVTQIALGVLFWTGDAHSLVPVHMLVGVSIVLCLWALAGMGAWARVGLGRVAFAVFWGMFVPVFGVVHGGILRGEWHWVIQVLHLAVGLAALGQAETLAKRIKERAAAGQERVAQVALA